MAAGRMRCRKFQRRTGNRSPYFTDLLRDGGLKNTSQRRGLCGSWSAWLPLARIPLDHGLVSQTTRVIEKRAGRQFRELKRMIDGSPPAMEAKAQPASYRKRHDRAALESSQSSPANSTRHRHLRWLLESDPAFSEEIRMFSGG
jgi:hypothetical protein